MILVRSLILNKKFFLVTSDNEIQCVAKFVNKNVSYFHKKYSIIEQRILENCESKRNFYINEKNYKDYINDLEVESFFDEIFCSDKILLPYQYKFLFLLAISDQGYNFGQYRIMSHLIKLGYKQNDFILFPLYISKNSYVYDKNKLKEILQIYKDQIYVCETSYIGWENQIREINSYIKSISNSIIMTGGPLTSSHLEFCLNKLNTDVVLTGHGEYVIEAFLKAALIQKKQLPNVNIPEVFYVGNFSNLKPINRINKYIELLYWDMELLSRLYEIVPIINLFTSEECKGNCIFCYRESYHNCNSIGKMV